MAIAQAQLNQLVNSEHGKPFAESKDRYMDDVPSEDGHLKLLKCSGSLEKAQIHQVSLKDNVMGTDIVANPNNIQATQQSERDRRSLFLILSCIKPESNLYRTLSDARFTTGRQAWTYLQASGIVYNPPSQSTAMEHKHRVAKWTWMNLPRDQQDKFLCIKFMGLLLGHNPMLHPSFDIPVPELVQIYCFGLHPQAKVEALTLLNDNAAAVAAGVVFPAVYPAYDPQAGQARPQAGAFEAGAFALKCSSIFQAKFEAGIFSLNRQPAINVVSTDVASDLPVPGQDASHFLFVSYNDVLSSESTPTEWNEYLLSVQRVQPDFRTCNNGGGVGHFAFEHGKFMCPTAQGTVPTDLLSQIKYPFGVRPWNFGKGKGKGKGMGKGRGKGADGAGRGRGHYQTYYVDDTGDHHAVAAPTVPLPQLLPAAPAPAEPQAASEADTSINAFEGIHVTDDYNWNQW